MTTENHDTIDFVVHAAKDDSVILCLVEHREWGEKGQLLPDLQAKLNTYFSFIFEGQLERQYPNLKGKKIRFRLFTQHPLGPREREFVRIVHERFLQPNHIDWEELPLSEMTTNEQGMKDDMGIGE